MFDVGRRDARQLGLAGPCPGAVWMTDVSSSARSADTPAGVALSIVVPVLNDAAALDTLLHRLAATSAACADVEIVVVDGGSSDGGPDAARAAGARVVLAPAGRGGQLAAGCAVAAGDWLWLLHADSKVDDRHVRVMRALSAPGWGRFDVDFDDAAPQFRILAHAMNVRSAVTGICTGDQGMFVHRELLSAAGGIPDQPLMEDIELSRRLKQLGRPMRVVDPIVTSSRRWREHGFVRTVLSMWLLRAAYWLGAAPGTLARRYYRNARG